MPPLVTIHGRTENHDPAAVPTGYGPMRVWIEHILISDFNMHLIMHIPIPNPRPLAGKTKVFPDTNKATEPKIHKGDGILSIKEQREI